MKKSVIFIFVLLTIIAAEMWALYHHKQSPSPIEYSLDVQEFTIPAPDVGNIAPFLFETKWADEVNESLNKIRDVVQNSYTDKFSSALNNLSSRQKHVAQVRQERSKGLERLRREAAQGPMQIKGDYLGNNLCVVDDVQGECKDGIYRLENHCIACYAGVCAGTTCSEKNKAQIAAEKNMPQKNEEPKSENTEPQVETKSENSVYSNEQEAVNNEANESIENTINSSFTTPAEGKALIAVVIDDVGLSVPFTHKIAHINKPITVAFLPYGASDKKQVYELKNAGFEVMLHVPMMPHVRASLAPNTLAPEMSRDDIQEKFKVMLKRFEGTGMNGVNNHMGSKFTESASALSAVIEVLKECNMFFLDSKTSSKSVAKSVCKQHNVPYIARDVFLDNERNYDAIMKQFLIAERIAKKRGYAVAIGHPYAQTLQALKDWEKQNEAHNVEIVPLSYLVQKIN